MILFEKIDLLIYSLLVSLLIILFINKTSFKERYINDAFKYAMISIVGYLIADIGSIFLGGVGGKVYLILHYIFVFFFYFFAPMASFFWVLLVDYEIFRDGEGLCRRIKKFYIYPIIINTVLSFVSIFAGWFFVLDENNVYSRGDLFNIHCLILYFYIALALTLALKYRKKLEKAFIFSIIIITVFPTLAGIIQTFNFGLELIWPAMTICAMLYFFIHQAGQLYFDYLTSLHNRRSLDDYLKTRLKKSPERFGGIMIDIFKFKLINDKYGHKVGDEVLIEVGKILRNSTESGDFLCRYSGDEFFIVSEVTENSELQKRIDRINETLKKFNEEGKFVFEISLSAGGVIYRNGKHKGDPDEFITDADIQMYKMKNRQKKEFSNHNSTTA
ncbi:MAG: hypothetical protein PWQ77_1510 [Kosmotogales bacterium]|nr:hypothetical protein [Kosmotogales bacterium]